jgi:hypothetical protein
MQSVKASVDRIHDSVQVFLQILYLLNCVLYRVRIRTKYFSTVVQCPNYCLLDGAAL